MATILVPDITYLTWHQDNLKKIRHQTQHDGTNAVKIHNRNLPLGCLKGSMLGTGEDFWWQRHLLKSVDAERHVGTGEAKYTARCNLGVCGNLVAPKAAHRKMPS